MTERLSTNCDPTMGMGADIIGNPQAAWSVTAPIPRNPDDTWDLLSRMGIQGEPENGAGYFLPKGMEPFIPRALRSVESLDAPHLPPQRQVGDRLRDFPEDSYAEVAVVDDETRTIGLDVHWPETPKRPNGLHYTYFMRVHDAGCQGAVLEEKTLVENPKNPRLVGLLGPRADQWAMQQLAKGLAQRIPGSPEDLMERVQRRDAQKATVAPVVAGLAVGNWLRSSPRPSIRAAGSFIGGAAVIRAGYRLARKTTR